MAEPFHPRGTCQRPGCDRPVHVYGLCRAHWSGQQSAAGRLIYQGATRDPHGQQYADYEREFLMAIDRYKREQRRPYPSWREVLQLLVELGWTPPAMKPAPREDV